MFRLVLAALLSVALTLPARAAENPLAPGEHTFQSDGPKLWYTVSGHGPVLIVPTPGWGPDATYLSQALQPLGEQFTTLFLETRASGHSQAPKTDRIDWADFTADLEALRAHVGSEKVWLLGHSMGGGQVMHYALAYPQHVGGLLLVDTMAQNDKAYFADFRQRVQMRSNEPWYPEAYKVLMGDGAYATQQAFDQSIMTIGPFYFADTTHFQQHAKELQASRMSLAAWNLTARLKFDLLADLPKITAPTLIVVGDKDFICSPTQAEILHRDIPNSKLLEIEDSGHFPFVEQPDAFFAGVRDFLPALGYGK